MSETTDALIEDMDDNTEEVKNFSAMPAKFVIDNMKITLPPGGTIRIHKHYTRPHKNAADRDPVTSAIENLTGNRVRPINKVV